MNNLLFLLSAIMFAVGFCVFSITTANATSDRVRRANRLAKVLCAIAAITNLITFILKITGA